MADLISLERGFAATAQNSGSCFRLSEQRLEPRVALERTQELMLKFERMDAADASLVVLSELHPRAVIVTVDDRDFRAYRRFRRDSLPLLTPRDT